MHLPRLPLITLQRLATLCYILGICALPFSAPHLVLSSTLCFGLHLTRSTAAHPPLPYPITLALLLLIATTALTLLIHPSIPALALLILTLLGSSACIMLAAGFIPYTPILLTFIASMCLQSGIGILQVVTSHNVGLTFLGEPAFTQNTLNIAKITTPDITTIRALGTLPHANILGALCTLALLISAAYPRRTWWMLPALVLLTMGTFLSFSRTAWLATVVGLLVLARYRTPRISQRILSVAFTSLILFALYSAPSLQHITDPSSHGALLTRSDQFRLAWDTIIHTPLGIGVGDTPSLLTATYPLLPSYALQPIHNFFLATALEQGILPALCWIALLLTLLHAACRTRTPSTPALIISLLILMQTDHAFATHAASFMLLFVLAGRAALPHAASSPLC